MRIIGDLVLAGFGQLKNARVENVSVDPASPQNGQIWYNTTDSVYRGFNGTEVVTFASGGNTQTILDALNAEVSNRTAADSVLTDGLAAETTARVAGDQAQADALAIETTARVAGDQAQTDALALETTARQGADATIQGNIDVEASARVAGDAASVAAVAVETTARQGADATLQGNIDSEASARTAADSAESAARIAEDGSIRTAFAAADAAALVASNAAIEVEASARVAGDALKVSKSGDSMSGNLAFGGLATVTGVTAPVNAADVTTKNYVDSLVSGLSWKMAVDAAGATNPVTVAAGSRFLNLTDSKIYTATAIDTFGAGVAAVDGDAVFNRADEMGFVFSGSAWVQFTGTGQVAAGIGLSKNGNQIDVNLGAGIAQLPSDEVGVDVRATGGLFLTEDGSAPSVGTDAQLAVRLDGSTLTVGANGVRVSAVVIGQLDAATLAISTETSARIAALDVETSARIAADAAAGTAAGAETSARQAADLLIQGSIDTEVTARAAAVQGVVDSLAVETTARVAGDQAQADALALEVTARTAAGLVLQGNVDAEASARTAADQAEVSARVAADDALSDRINNGYFLYDGAVAAASHTVVHDIGTKYCQVLVVDSSDKVVIPDAITFNSNNQLTVDFISAITCKVVVSALKVAG